VKSQAIAAVLSSLNDELGRLNDMQGPRYVSDAEWEPVRVVLRAFDAIGKIKAEDVDHARLDRINSQGGALSWRGRSFAEHPDRCECQGDDPIPHRHYGDAPYRCARCGKCEAYSPVSNPADESSVKAV
jgi:hypothetical protein